MALTGTLEVPPELLELFRKLLSSTDTRRRGAVRKHGYLQSRQQVTKLTTRSLLPQISDLRAGLTPAEIDQWKAAAAANSQNWWNLFVQDTAYRIKYGLPGLATPSLLHQYKVGRVEINAPADKVILKQYHPYKYYVNKKKRGNTTQRHDVAVFEKLVLPLEIEASYRCQLVPQKEDYSARFYAEIISSYQGRNIYTQAGFDFDINSDWTRGTAVINEVTGVVRSYNLYIELDGVRGWLEWDNVVARHTATNWARDWRCTDVNNELTRANFQIEASWEEQVLPNGSAFDSVYPAD